MGRGECAQGIPKSTQKTPKKGIRPKSGYLPDRGIFTHLVNFFRLSADIIRADAALRVDLSDMVMGASTLRTIPYLSRSAQPAPLSCA